MSSHVSFSRLGLACAAIFAVAACERSSEAPPAESGDELAWMRAALERNPHIEVVASDAQKRVFTIRDRRSGDVQAVPLDQLAAAPLAQLQFAPPSAVAGPAPPADPRTPAAEQNPQAGPAQRASQPPAVEQAAAGTPRQSTSSDAGYTIERTDGQLRVSGPGVSIVSSGRAGAQAQASDAARASEPIICEGRRMVHFDNREIYVDGDAITVRDGCEMFITNSRIVAAGTGITVSNGVVHVSNSHIEGAQGAFDADAQARMYVRGSTFQGVSRRDERAMVQDQGGNRWR